jgi:hypothetical protein
VLKLKSRLYVTIFFILSKFALEHFMLYLKEEKVCICGLAYVLSPQKRMVPPIRFSEGLLIRQIIEARQLTDLRFAELFCGTPTFT